MKNKSIKLNQSKKVFQLKGFGQKAKALYYAKTLSVYKLVRKTTKYENYKALISISLTVLILVVGISIYKFPTLVEPKVLPINTIKATILTYSTDHPSEDQVSDYHVSDKNPRLINFPSLGIKGFIEQVGVDQNNAIAVPDNINMAGWYVNSVKPGESGLSIIDGHVDGLYSDGVFNKIQFLQKDDTFEVEYGDGHVVNFKVVDIQTPLNAGAAKVLYSKHSDIKSQLNLITCGGTYSKDKKTYDHRVIVVSEQI